MNEDLLEVHAFDEERLGYASGFFVLWFWACWVYWGRDGEDANQR
jgi:hypothetical protein